MVVWCGVVVVVVVAVVDVVVMVVVGGGGDAGVLMSILASIASNLGVNVQKFSMMREARRGPARQRPYVAQPLWFAGLLLVIGGSIGDFAALGFAAQSLITPVGGFTMVANVIFAHFWLGEHLSRLDLGGTAAVVLGVVLIAAFASKKESCAYVCVGGGSEKE